MLQSNLKLIEGNLGKTLMDGHSRVLASNIGYFIGKG